MARDGKRNMNTEACSEIAQRAAWFTATTDAGRHADKRTAQRFGVSVRMAQMLRAGQGWTLQRVEQARRSFGPSFDHVVFGPFTGQAGGPSHALAEELAAIRSRIDTLAANWARGPLDAGRPAVGADGNTDPYRVAPIADRATVRVDRRETDEPHRQAAEVKAAE